MLLAETVHTTGVNWDGIIVNAGVITTAISLIGAYFVRRINNSWAANTQKIVDSALKPILATLKAHGERIAYLEGVESGKKQVVSEAGLSKT